MSVGGFVPKPHTPFQWFGQNGVDELQRKIALLRDDAARAPARRCKWHDPERDVRRGHRAAAATAGSAGSSSGCGAAGGTFQEWSEHFALDRWLDAMARRGPRPRLVRHPAPHPTTRCCPWDHIAAGLHPDFLWDDWQAALAEHGLPDCRWTPCYDCGVCTDYALEHVVASPVPPAGGSQGTGQDLGAGGEVPGAIARHASPRRVDVVRAAPEGRRRFPVRLRYTKRGKVRLDLAPRRRPRRSSGRSASTSSRSRSREGSRPGRR